MSRRIPAANLLIIATIAVVAGNFMFAAPIQANGNQPDQVRCGLSITPTWTYVAQGGTAIFDVNVFCSTGNPVVELLYSPPTIGFTVTFSVNNQPAPYSSKMTVKVDASKPPGNYTLPIFSHPAGAPFPGPLNDYQNVFAIVVPPPTGTSVAQTDWELTNAYIVPTNPTQGTSATFAVTLRAVSTTAAFPQTVRIEILGQNIVGTFGVNYNGPVGSAISITHVETLNLPAGEHTVYLYADPPLPYQYNDPNRANNGASVKFTVGTSTTASSSYSYTGWIAATTTTSNLVTGWSATSTTTQQTTEIFPGFYGVFGQNMFGPWNTTIVLLLAVIVAGVLVTAWKWSHPKVIEAISRRDRAPEPAGPAEGVLICTKCGTHVSIGQQFCRRCGTALK